MKKKDLLMEQFNEFKLLTAQSKVVFGGMCTTTGDTSSGSPSKSDDCDSDNDTTTTPAPAPLPAIGNG
jgi:hypothetical protein